MLEEAFAPHDPRTYSSKKDGRGSRGHPCEAEATVYPPSGMKKIIPQIMTERGVDLQKSVLRCAPPALGLSLALPVVWYRLRLPPASRHLVFGTNVSAELVAPIYPLEPDNAMGFYPHYFAGPVKNNSEIYNYYEWNMKNRATAQHVKSDAREQPKAQQVLDPVTVRLLPPPGGIILFSGARLHETVPNTTKVARYSIDFRTVHYDDVVARRGASNIDSRSTGTTMRDYLRASDLMHLPEDAIALYDDDTAKSKEMLYFGDMLARGAGQQK